MMAVTHQTMKWFYMGVSITGVLLLYNKNGEAIHKRHMINPINGLQL
jgi:hypothetical protein